MSSSTRKLQRSLQELKQSRWTIVQGHISHGWYKSQLREAGILSTLLSSWNAALWHLLQWKPLVFKTSHFNTDGNRHWSAGKPLEEAESTSLEILTKQVTLLLFHLSVTICREITSSVPPFFHPYKGGSGRQNVFCNYFRKAFVSKHWVITHLVSTVWNIKPYKNMKDFYFLPELFFFKSK